MSVPRFRAKNTVKKTLKEGKADRIPTRIVLAGNGDGATVATGRTNFYYVRVEDEDGNALWISEAFSPDIPLAYDDRVVIQRMEDAKLSYYRVIKWLEDSGGGTAQPLPIHAHSDNVTGGQNLRQILELEFEDATLLTIDAAGAVTRTQVYHRIDTFGGAATDDLDTINGGVEGDELIIRPENDARTIVVRHNVGNIWLIGAANVSLEDTEDHLRFIYDGTTWCSVGDGGGGGNTLDQAYDQGGAGAGRTIAVDTGAVQMQAPDATQHALECQREDAATNTTLEILRLIRLVDAGVGANGLGGRVLWQLEDGGGNTDDGIALDAVWTTAAAGSEDSRLHLWRRRGGAALAFEGWVGERVDSVTRTVNPGGGAQHLTIQSAVDWFKGKLITGSCKIMAAAASYDEAVIFEDLFIGANGSLELEGDTRVLAAMTWVEGAACNPVGLANGGSGTAALVNAGATITVTGTVSNPDFAADGWVNGDTVLVYDNAGTVNVYTINGTAANVITLTVAAPAVGNDGTAIMLIPDRAIARTAAGPCITVDMAKGVLIDGWYLDTAAGALCDGVRVNNGGSVAGENVGTRAEDFGVLVNGWYGWASLQDGACSFWESTYGVYALRAAYANANYSVAVGHSAASYRAASFSIIYSYKAVSVNSVDGFQSSEFSYIYAGSCTGRQHTGTAYYADNGSFMQASSTNANNNNPAGADYSPVPGAIPGYGNGNGNADLYAS